MIDRQAHDDVVGLIEAEMAQAHPDFSVSAERLACVIEGRHGITTPEKSIIPNLPPQPWHTGRNPRDAGQVELIDANGNGFLIWVGGDHDEVFMKLCMTAPELAQWMYGYARDNMLSSGSPTVEPMTSLIRLLQKAGVTL